VRRSDTIRCIRDDDDDRAAWSNEDNEDDDLAKALAITPNVALIERHASLKRFCGSARHLIWLLHEKLSGGEGEGAREFLGAFSIRPTAR